MGTIDKKSLEVLNNDKNNILFILYNIKNSVKNESNNIYIDKEFIEKIIINNHLVINNYLNKNFKDKSIKIDINKTFKEFIEDDIFGLKECYLEMMSRNGIRIIGNKEKYYGLTLYLKSLNKNYINIFKTNEIYDALTLIHELSHAVINLQPRETQYYYSTNLLETFPILMELLFLEFIKKYDLEKVSYNIKNIYYLKICGIIDELYNNLPGSISEEYFYNKVNIVISSILAFKLYNDYLINKDITINNIFKFISTFGNASDRELIENMGISIKQFTNARILINFSQT